MRKLTEFWIGRSGAALLGTDLPAPFLRRQFALDFLPKSAKVHVCGLGLYELQLNGCKVGDSVLDPVPTRYDRRARYLVHDVSSHLKLGENVIGVILGNGLFNSSWNVWREYPKLSLRLEVDGKTVLVSDESWKMSDGPIVFNGLQAGETYDARLELSGWSSPGYDDSAWQPCAKGASPGGVIEEQVMPSCKVMETIAPVRSWTLDNGDRLYDFGQNIAGWARLAVSGDAGTEVEILYGERLDSKGALTQEGIAPKKGRFQRDCYILKGQGEEVWSPRFTYHGFQYASVSVKGRLAGINLEGCFVHSAFAEAGTFACSDERLNRLQECFLRSYRSNFVGIPTDCPHREKAGWTADAHIVAESGLFNYDSASCYAQWLDNFADVQRPDGRLPGIVPSCGGGIFWESGTAWDSALFIIPWHLYVHTGDLSAVERSYEAMRRYIEFCPAMAEGNIVAFGLGDWLHPGQKSHHPWKPEPCDADAPLALVCTAYYYEDCKLLAKFAGLLGKPGERREYSLLAEDVRRSFNKAFYKGDGLYSNGSQCGQALALHCGLVEDGERAAVAATLARDVEAHAFKVNFGMLGSKCVPRALSENGYAGHAYRLLTQKEFPGWGFWLDQGANTLWEQWDGTESRNHPTFGDFSAWLYQYPAGINPDPEKPGFRHIILKPQLVEGLTWVKASHRVPAGVVSSSWKRHGDKAEFEFEIPAGCKATASLPDGRVQELDSGSHRLFAQLP